MCCFVLYSSEKIVSHKQKADSTLPPWILSDFMIKKPVNVSTTSDFTPFDSLGKYGVQKVMGLAGSSSDKTSKDEGDTSNKATLAHEMDTTIHKHFHHDPIKRYGKGMHLIVPSYDGHIYVINSMKGCAERIDIGEHIYSTPLFDDITGDGYMDMLVGTMNGEMLLFETSIPHHPINSWSSYPKHQLNGFTHGVTGISIPATEKK